MGSIAWLARALRSNQRPGTPVRIPVYLVGKILFYCYVLPDVSQR